MADQLGEIKKAFERAEGSMEHIGWLIAEVERLRAVKECMEDRLGAAYEILAHQEKHPPRPPS